MDLWFQNQCKYHFAYKSVQCYWADDVSKRVESEKIKKYTYDKIIIKDKTNFDITWLKDASLENLENLSEPEVLAKDIIEHLESALASFKSVIKD